MGRVYFFLLTISISIILFCASCGETVKGMNKDAHRIGQGVKTVFVSEE